MQKISRKFSSSEVTVDGGVNMSYKPIAPAPTGSNHTPPGEFHCALFIHCCFTFIFSPFEVFFVNFFKRTVLILEKGVSEPTVKEVRDTDKGGGVKGAIAICLAHYINVVYCAANRSLSRLCLKAVFLLICECAMPPHQCI